jgi:hypothetical protein
MPRYDISEDGEIRGFMTAEAAELGIFSPTSKITKDGKRIDLTELESDADAERVKRRFPAAFHRTATKGKRSKAKTQLEVGPCVSSDSPLKVSRPNISSDTKRVENGKCDGCVGPLPGVRVSIDENGLIMNNDGGGHPVERCDTCQLYPSDHAAQGALATYIYVHLPFERRGEK